MTQPKLTEWFPPEVKPVRVGVYEVAYPPGRWFRKWDGTRWMCGADTPEIAVERSAIPVETTFPWRGLAEEPK